MSLGLVVIAEDDPELRDVLSTRCAFLGLDVAVCADAMTALQTIAERKPQIAVLDVGLPHGSGLGVCEMMAQHADLATIPVIVLTGKRDAETVSRCYALGTYFVPKCTDVWPRVERLLVDLLQLDEVRQRHDGAHGAGEISPAHDMVEPPAVANVLDEVFTALGAAKPGATEDDQDSEPWVLCIDDDKDLLRSLELRFMQHGVRLRAASAGRSGYRLAFASSAGAVILDYHMSDGDGLYVLRRLKESRATCDIPVVMLTGRRDSRLERLALNAGAEAFLVKPCPWNDLWRVVEPFLCRGESADREASSCLVGADAE